MCMVYLAMISYSTHQPICKADSVADGARDSSWKMLDVVPRTRFLFLIFYHPVLSNNTQTWLMQLMLAAKWTNR